jgi:hypothetical protein
MRYKQNVRLQAGDDRTLSIAVLNSGSFDMTGMSARYVVARTAFDPRPPLIDKTSAAGITIVLPPNPAVPAGYGAVLNVVLDNNDTAALAPGWYYHEAEVTLTDGTVITVMSGDLRLDPSWIASTL